MYIPFIILCLICLSFIDRWFFRKIVITEITPIDSNRKRVKTISYIYFGLIKRKIDFIEYQGRYYMEYKQGDVSTNEIEPRFFKKAMLKYNLQKGLNN